LNILKYLLFFLYNLKKVTIKNKFLIFLLIFLSILSTGCKSKKINNFSELINGIKSGAEIKVRIHYSKCDLFSNGQKIKNSPEAIGGMTLDVFEYFTQNSIDNKEAYIATSKNKLINYKNKKIFRILLKFVFIKIMKLESMQNILQGKILNQ